MASFTENFDAVTPPAVPASFSVQSGSYVSFASGFVSAPNALKSNALNTNCEAWADPVVGADAVLQVTVAFNISSDFTDARVGYRRQEDSLECYFAILQIGATDNPKGLSLYKRSAGGSYTQIVAPIGGSAFAYNAFYKIKCMPVGTAHKVRCQRLSDSKWLQADGSWDVAEVNAITATDATTAAAGGLTLLAYSADSEIYFDDVSYADPTTPATAYTLTGPATMTGAEDTYAVVVNGTFTGTVTLSSTDGGDAFDPGAAIVYTAETGSKSRDITWDDTTAHRVLSATDTGSLTDPASITIRPLSSPFELSAVSGLPLYYVLKNPAGLCYKPSSSAFVANTVGNWPDVAVTLPEYDAAGGYSRYFFDAIPQAAKPVAGTYTIEVYQKAGADPDKTEDGPAIYGDSYVVTAAFTVSGPSSGTVDAASTAFTVTLVAPANGTDTITITSSVAGDTITPSVGSPATHTKTVTPANGATSFTYTVTASSAGARTLTYTTGQGWSVPAPSAYTAAAAGGGAGALNGSQFLLLLLS